MSLLTLSNRASFNIATRRVSSSAQELEGCPWPAVRLEQKQDYTTYRLPHNSSARHCLRRSSCQEVSSHPGETGHASQKKHRNTPGTREKSRANQKKLCQSVEQAENHKKGSRWSWAGNH